MRFFPRVLLVFIAFATPLAWAAPFLLNYQGRIVADGVNFTGSGRFKFALVNAAGTTTYWSNDGTLGGAEPLLPVTLPVEQGYYAILLGDSTLPNMAALTPAVFQADDLRLRVWFDDGVNGFERLAPDHRLASAASALIAETVRPGAITPTLIGAAPADLSGDTTLQVLAKMRRVEDFITQSFAPPPARDLPVITLSPGENTALSSPVVYRPYIVGTGVQVLNSDGQGDSNIRFSPGTYASSNGGQGDFAMYGEIKPGGAAQFARWTFDATFVTSASNSVVEVGFFSLNTFSDEPMIEVNGRRVADAAPLRTFGGNGWKLTLTFPTAASRRIVLTIPGAAGLMAIRVPTGNTITKPTDAIGKRMAIIGDSFVNGAGSGSSGNAFNHETFAPMLAHLLGADERLLAGIGGTGFVAGGTTNNYETRLPYVLGKNPHVLIFFCSINDGTNGAGLQAAVTSALALCTAVPEVYVIGCVRAGYEASNAAAKTATLAAGRKWVNMDGFINGTGRITDRKGDGNADFFIVADGVHPTLEGHRALARGIFRQMSGTLY